MPLDPLKALGLPESALAKLSEAQSGATGGIPSQLTDHEVAVITAIQHRLIAAAADQAESQP